MSRTAATIDQLLRDRAGVLTRIAGGVELFGLVRANLVTVFVAAGLFGAALGSYRGGLQVLFAGVKLPLVLLLTAAVATPFLTAVSKGLGRETDLSRDISIVSTSLALTSLILAASAPAVLLAVTSGASYHQVALLFALCAAVGGGAGLLFFWRGLGRIGGRHRLVIGCAVIAVFTLVGAQMAWTLRPYLVRPRSPSVPFVRTLEGSLGGAVFQSVESARGNYYRDNAPVPEVTR